MRWGTRRLEIRAASGYTCPGPVGSGSGPVGGGRSTPRGGRSTPQEFLRSPLRRISGVFSGASQGVFSGVFSGVFLGVFSGVFSRRRYAPPLKAVEDGPVSWMDPLRPPGSLAEVPREVPPGGPLSLVWALAVSAGQRGPWRWRRGCGGVLIGDGGWGAMIILAVAVAVVVVCGGCSICAVVAVVMAVVVTVGLWARWVVVASGSGRAVGHMLGSGRRRPFPDRRRERQGPIPLQRIPGASSRVACISAVPSGGRSSDGFLGRGGRGPVGTAHLAQQRGGFEPLTVSSAVFA